MLFLSMQMQADLQLAVDSEAAMTTAEKNASGL
jgi:hypothetical protein